MRTKNLTGFPFGAKVTSRKPPQREMTLIVRGTFLLRPDQPLVPVGGPNDPLAQGFMTAEVFHKDDDARAGASLYPGDFADFKLRTDVFLRGSCHVPEGRPVTECPVRFSVGDWSKSLRVVGRRVWSDAYGGAAKSAPLPFTKMPIDWDHAFGGAGYAQNPAGKGVGTAELPNIEHPGDPVRAREDRLKPISFGPINSAWPQRSGKMGKEYGKAYREQRAPFYAEDFDWTYFNAAPEDQQLPGYLRGDEELGFVNLHPDAPIWSARLPGLRVRAFVIDRDERFREVKLYLDTLFVDLDLGTVALTWRGLDGVKEDDLTDVRTVLVVSEPLDGPSETEGQARERLDAYERDPLGLAEHTPKGMPDPADARKKVDAMFAAAAASKGSAEGTGSVGPLLQLFSGPGRETMGGDVGKMLSASATGTQDHFALSAALAAAAGATGNDGPRAAPGPLVMPAATQAPSFADPRARAAVRAMPAQVAEARTTTVATGVPAEHLAALDAVGATPQLAALGAEPADAPAPGPGRSLPGVDWSGRDLAGVDLRNADLTGAKLAGANLRGANLSGARLHGAVLFEAILEDADLSSTDLTLANLTGARAAGVNLGGALLDKTFFDRADLARADLRRATGDSTLFQTASLPGAKLGITRFEQASFQGANLDGADFGAATLTRCLILESSAKEADFSRAVLIKTSFIDCDLEGARFVESRGERAVFLRTRMGGADFSYAHLPSSHFTEARGSQVKFFAANLREARLYRASLDRADFGMANLFSADFSKAVLTGARFVGANLYDAKFIGASGAGCDFTDANLKRCTLENA